LLNLAAMPQPKKVAIIGDMRELGEESETEHAEILALANSLNFNQLITVGNDFGHAQSLEKGENVIARHEATMGVHFSTNLEAKDFFKKQTFDADTCILIKGSRGMKLEVLTQ
jgi:UDP-N-acetylmuramoyl-tripeptide--D-alanyl-D-alanine ligase